jgi:hypothetical protein
VCVATPSFIYFIFYFYFLKLLCVRVEGGSDMALMCLMTWHLGQVLRF